ncbi:hypothetical protein D1O30_12130 [Methylocystis hirsuta]|uniref:Uncharacterized protein n=1 Tax=Methylocystis hirsuta TaxID=369798 RepID=A0A3M9XR29_9HYPH|nr:hypothetical protein D1O30_12130 [Methylocystis hirsuta]
MPIVSDPTFPILILPLDFVKAMFLSLVTDFLSPPSSRQTDLRSDAASVVKSGPFRMLPFVPGIFVSFQ